MQRGAYEMDYWNKIILAPMVRIGTLAFRLLALKYGADIVYSEELIDRKIIQTKRVVNNGIIEYICTRNNSLVWQTCPEEHHTVVQIGTASDITAIQAAEHMFQDYDAIDVNMGCPEKFSVVGGMGAALLVDRERVKLILSGLVRNISKPITCKIRLLNSLENTVDLVRTIEEMGVKAIAIHGRYISQRPRQPAHMDLIKILAESVKIPTIANGDIFVPEDIEKTKEITGCSSVMIGRGALINCSIFSKSDPRPQKEVCLEYIKNCIKYNNTYAHTKYTVSRIFGEFKRVTKEHWYHEMIHSKSHGQILQILKDEIDQHGANGYEWGRRPGGL